MKAKQPMKMNSSYPLNFKKLFLQHITIIFWSAYLYVFLEWLFFITKPSFFSSISALEKVNIFLKTSFLLALFGALVLAVVLILRSMFPRIIPPVVLQYLVTIVPAGILSILTLLLVDNFTYTIFKVGVVTTSGIWRGVYGLLYILLLLIIWHWLVNRVSGKVDGSFQRASYALVLVSILFILLDLNIIRAVDPTSRNLKPASLPNILLLGSDGINASNISVYGYDRETTPTISALAGRSLVMENAFTNAGNSAGSAITILTGKNATETRVLYPPDILRDADSFEHLPGILRQQGYLAVELGVHHYVDAYNMNMLDGFDQVNGKMIQKTILMRALEPLGYDVAYFSSKLIDRITDRLFHVLYLKQMENVYSVVTDASVSPGADREKIEHLLKLIEDAEQPLFVHLHLMGTHGPRFYPRQQVFSLGEQQVEDWMPDFYDDSILDFDAYVEEVLDQLTKVGKLNNTIVVIYTDHNMRYFTNQRIPLIIYFPNEEYVGNVSANAQNIDIAPTLLDYLGMVIPNWMEGSSLLDQDLDMGRLIFSTGAAYAHVTESNGALRLDIEKLHPPFYQFGYLGIVNCQNWYRYHLITHEWTSGVVNGHSSPCDDGSLLTPEQIKDALLNHLDSKGFDVSMLVESISLPPIIQHTD